MEEFIIKSAEVLVSEQITKLFNEFDKRLKNLGDSIWNEPEEEWAKRVSDAASKTCKRPIVFEKEKKELIKAGYYAKSLMYLKLVEAGKLLKETRKELDKKKLH